MCNCGKKSQPQNKPTNHPTSYQSQRSRPPISVINQHQGWNGNANTPVNPYQTPPYYQGY